MLNSYKRLSFFALLFTNFYMQLTCCMLPSKRPQSQMRLPSWCTATSIDPNRYPLVQALHIFACTYPDKKISDLKDFIEKTRERTEISSTISEQLNLCSNFKITLKQADPDVRRLVNLTPISIKDLFERFMESLPQPIYYDDLSSSSEANEFGTWSDKDDNI